MRRTETQGLRRIPVSLTSSALRLPPSLVVGLLKSLNDPVVLFVHPWEFVDLRYTRLRWDCRFQTGPQALVGLHLAIDVLRSQSADFLPLTSL